MRCSFGHSPFSAASYTLAMASWKAAISGTSRSAVAWRRRKLTMIPSITSGVASTVGSAAASVAWTSAVASPSARASAWKSASASAARSATRQASVTPGRNSCAKATCPMARPSSRPESLHSASTLPMVCGTRRDPAPAMADWSTTSGFSPWCSARNTLTIIGFTAWPSAETMS